MKPESEIDSFNAVNKVVELMIENYSKIFQEEGLEDIVENYFRSVQDETSIPQVSISESNEESASASSSPEKVLHRAPSFKLSQNKQKELHNLELDRLKDEASKLEAIKKRKSMEYFLPEDGGTRRDRSVSEADTKPPVIADGKVSDPSRPRVNRPQRSAAGKNNSKFSTFIPSSFEFLF